MDKFDGATEQCPSTKRVSRKWLFPKWIFRVVALLKAIFDVADSALDLLGKIREMF